MSHCDDELRQATALFRYGVIADLVHLPLGTPGVAATMRDKAAQTYSTRVIPFAAFTTVENTQAFLPVFSNALIRHGIPK